VLRAAEGLPAERNPTPCVDGRELFRAYLETSIDQLNQLEMPGFRLEDVDSFV
jgi:hypothetical protein